MQKTQSKKFYTEALVLTLLSKLQHGYVANCLLWTGIHNGTSFQQFQAVSQKTFQSIPSMLLRIGTKLSLVVPSKLELLYLTPLYCSY